MSSASGVARRGDFVYVIGDDLLYLAQFRLSEPGPGTLRRVFDEREGPAEDEARPRGAHRCCRRSTGMPFGALLGLGSGSGAGARPRLRRGRWPPTARCAASRAVIDLGPLYALLGERIDGLNIEGACVMGERLWLLHRGNRGSMHERGGRAVAAAT